MRKQLEMLAVFTSANQLGFEPGLNSSEVTLLANTPRKVKDAKMAQVL